MTSRTLGRLAGGLVAGLGAVLIVVTILAATGIVPLWRPAVPRPPALIEAEATRAAALAAPTDALTPTTSGAVGPGQGASSPTLTTGSPASQAGGVAPGAVPSSPSPQALARAAAPQQAASSALGDADAAGTFDLGSATSSLAPMPSADPLARATPSAFVPTRIPTLTPLPTLDLATLPTLPPLPTRELPPTPTPRPTPVPPPPPPGLPTHLVIPSIKVDTPVLELSTTLDARGVPQWETVPFIAGHYRVTGLVGAPTNVVLSGHVATRDMGNVFRDLHLLRPGDPIVVYTDKGEFTYRVSELRLVPPSDTSALAPTREPHLTLITCAGEFDFRAGGFTERLIVVGDLVK